MIRLTASQVIKLHEQLIQQTGGSHGIRDMGLLESAVEAPFQAFGEHELYPSIQAKAARLGYGLIKNHAMIDGNKRIGAHAMLVMLALNGVSLRYTQKDLYTVILDVAAGQKDMKTCWTGFWKSRFEEGASMEVIAENKHYAFADCWAWSNNRCELIEETTAVDGNEPELDCTVYVTETVSGGMARENKHGIELFQVALSSNLSNLS